MTSIPMTTVTLVNASVGITQFSSRNGRVWLSCLCGMPIGWQGEDSGPARTQGMALIQVDGQRYEGNALTLESMEKQEHAVLCLWKVANTPLRLSTAWQGCPDTGIISRRDTLTNSGKDSVTISRCLARLAFPPGCYECYTQASRWCHENQGIWQPLHTGVTLRHAWGRTTEESTPYLALRSVGGDRGLALHVLPQGNWTIRMSPVAEGGNLPYAVVELGLADENLHRVLVPGESLVLPEILIQPLPQGEPHLGTAGLHHYLLAHHFAGAKPEAPVVYNTWFDQFQILEVERLRTQLAAAKELGCEVFVIDAGWYGASGPDWWAQTGDWREKTEAAFCGKMHAFASEVRTAGLGFGLWMEPERFGSEAPIRNEHPEWFIPVGVSARLDLAQPDTYAYLRGEIGRLVETYLLAWMKIDFNFILDADASGGELSEYTTLWYRLLDEIRAAYPRTFFEGCSSGAMRGDLATLSHVDGHFLSDTVNPVDVFRISQSAWLRLPPGRLTRWTVVRSAGQAAPRYGRSLADSPPIILTPGGALWEPAETVDLNFALLAAMPGMLGFSGDLAGLPPEHREGIAEAIAFYKSWRRFITKSVAHLLMPPETMVHRDGWGGVQLQVPGDDTSLVFIYRLGNAGTPQPFRLRGLAAEARYNVQCGVSTTAATTECTGSELLREGLRLPSGGHLAAPGHGAEVFRIHAQSRSNGGQI